KVRLPRLYCPEDLANIRKHNSVNSKTISNRRRNKSFSSSPKYNTSENPELSSLFLRRERVVSETYSPHSTSPHSTSPHSTSPHSTSPHSISPNKLSPSSRKIKSPTPSLASSDPVRALSQGMQSTSSKQLGSLENLDNTM